MVINVKHDPKGTGVPQTQLITKTKKILPKGAKPNRFDNTVSKESTMNGSNTQFPNIFKERGRSSEILKIPAFNVKKAGSVPRQNASMLE